MDDLNQLIAQLNSADIPVCIAAAEQLGRLSDPRARDALKARFTPYRFMRGNTEAQNQLYFTLALLLAEMGSYHEYRIVVDEAAPFVRKRVVELLEHFGQTRAIHAAVLMLSSADAGERYWAAEILSALKATLASAALIAAQAREPLPEIRVAIVRSLIHAGDTDAIPVLQKMQDDPNAEIRRLSALALKKLKPTDR